MRRVVSATLVAFAVVRTVSAADAHDVDDALGAGRFEAAERAARAHLAAVERREGAQQNEIADALDRAAEAIAANWAVTADSLSLAERAVELRRKVSGESGPELASSLYNLARIAQRRGVLELARDSDERSLAILEEAQERDCGLAR